MPDNSRYRFNPRWFFVEPRPAGFEDVPVLENEQGGRVVVDNVIRSLLLALKGENGRSTEELEGENLVSRQLLKIFLKVFTTAGVITHEGNSESATAADTAAIPDTAAFSAGVSRGDVMAAGSGEETPLISVVIVNYNGDAHLPELLASLERQSYPNREIIVVDNHSRDNSRVFIREHYPRTLLLEQDRNTGFAAAVNTGVAASRGEYILVLNNDILVDERALEHLAKRAAQLGDHWGAIAPKMKFYNNRAFINALGNSLYPISWGSDNFIGALDLGQFDHVTESFSACFGAVLLNRRATEAVGVLDPRYGFYYEDMDWSYRAQVRGYPVYTAPEAVIYHKFGASMSAESQAFKTRYVVGNRLYFTAGNFSGALRRRFLSGYMREDFRAMLTHLRQGGLAMFFAYIRGYLRLLGRLPALLVKSRENERARRRSGIQHHHLLAHAVPFNLTTLDQGHPRLDVFSLRINYRRTALGEEAEEANATEIVLQRSQPPADRRNRGGKLYMEFSFHISQPGRYSIHLAGLLRGSSYIYLDGDKATPDGAPFSKKPDIIREIGIFSLTAGDHYVELPRRNHAQAVIIRKVDKN